ncbi:hypothetical protein [Streptomyces sp. cmx-4-7]|uniref:hypothetical protein n=1 Tax=Streptomyces sp. cmx-4-7 TaxID=2790939 RepID=UPI00397FF840
MIDVVCEDVDRVRAELVAAVSEGRRGSAAPGAGGPLGALALVAARETTVRALERVWPAQRVAGAPAAGYGVGAVALAGHGYGRLRRTRAASREAPTGSPEAVRGVADGLTG